MTVIANRLDGIVREMTNTLLRAARSAVISSARDFSCCIITGDNQLLASAEGLPVHIFGAHFQGENMCKYHAGDIREGDAYLDNDPYGGNTHPADHTFLVPVFIEGEHLFTTVAKCHMADIGNSIPSSYFAKALDVYEEGALVFPGVRIQRNFKNEPDIIRMCRARIRVPEQWYGDSLAALGSARIAERRLKELCAKYGKRDHQDLHQGLVRLFRAADDGVDPQAAEGAHREHRPIRSARRHPARRPHAEGHHRHRSEEGDDRRRPARQSDMRRLRAQHVARGGHQLGRGRDLQQPGEGHSAQCRLVPPAVVPICREQRGRRTGVPAQLLDRDHQRVRAARQHHAIGVRQARRRSRPFRRRHRARRRHGGALGQGPPAQRRALRQPHDALDQRRPGEPDRRRLGQLRDSGDRRA